MTSPAVAVATVTHAGFGAVVCQFGVMFFPEKGLAYAEVARVLRPGGMFIFNVWDAIEHNEFADVVTSAVAKLFPDDPPNFLARTPHVTRSSSSPASSQSARMFRMTNHTHVVTLT